MTILPGFHIVSLSGMNTLNNEEGSNIDVYYFLLIVLSSNPAITSWAVLDPIINGVWDIPALIHMS